MLPAEMALVHPQNGHAVEIDGGGRTRRYLDNAATSFPKPVVVARAVQEYLTGNGAPGRGLYAEAREAGALVQRCRERLCEVFGAPRSSASNVVFGYNTTDALNLAIKGVVSRARRAAVVVGGMGDGRARVVTTAAEHNSVLRPLHRLASEGAIEWSIVPVDPLTGLVSAAAVLAEVRKAPTALVAVNHASNVSGCVQPIETIGRGLREMERAGGGHGAQGRCLFLVDGAQSLGHWPVDVEAACIDLLAFPGHKGLLGPQGIGGLWIRPGVESLVDTTREGGSGNVSELPSHPSMMPEKFEAGSQNVVGIAGLLAGVEWTLERSVKALREHEAALIAKFLGAFDPYSGRGYANSLPGLRLVGLAPVEQRVGVFSLVHEALSPAELAMVLESEFGVLSRPGLHCAPLMHKALGTLHEADAAEVERGPGESTHAEPSQVGRAWGACRLSFGPFVTMADVEYALSALGEICSGSSVAGR